MRIMLDTNVLVSALLFPGQKMNALMEKVTTDHQLVLSSYIGDDDFRDVDIEKPEIVTPAGFLDKY